MTEIINLYLGATLHVGDKKYRICEVEYYFKETGNTGDMEGTGHSDPYVHCDSEQLQKETFYFHRINGKGFKEGTYKGMDITFGDNGYGGLLVRSIQSQDDDNIIEGPCLVVQEIIRRWAQEGITKVVDFYKEYSKKNPDLSIFKPDSGLYVELGEAVDDSKISLSPRVGLKLKRPGLEEKIKYVMKNYRATTVPNKLKKQKTTIRLSAIKDCVADKVRPLEEFADLKSYKVADLENLYHTALHHTNG
jgi:hypothetical protein